jgi:hypothetical protein
VTSWTSRSAPESLTTPGRPMPGHTSGTAVAVDGTNGAGHGQTHRRHGSASVGHAHPPTRNRCRATTRSYRRQRDSPVLALLTGIDLTGKAVTATPYTPPATTPPTCINAIPTTCSSSRRTSTTPHPPDRAPTATGPQGHRATGPTSHLHRHRPQSARATRHRSPPRPRRPRLPRRMANLPDHPLPHRPHHQHPRNPHLGQSHQPHPKPGNPHPDRQPSPQALRDPEPAALDP